MKRLAFVAAIALALSPSAALAQRFCTSSFWVTMGGERVKVCCAQGLCTTKYGVYTR